MKLNIKSNVKPFDLKINVEQIYSSNNCIVDQGKTELLTLTVTKIKSKYYGTSYCVFEVAMSPTVIIVLV